MIKNTGNRNTAKILSKRRHRNLQYLFDDMPHQSAQRTSCHWCLPSDRPQAQQHPSETRPGAMLLQRIRGQLLHRTIGDLLQHCALGATRRQIGPAQHHRFEQLHLSDIGVHMTRSAHGQLQRWAVALLDNRANIDGPVRGAQHKTLGPNVTQQVLLQPALQTAELLVAVHRIAEAGGQNAQQDLMVVQVGWRAATADGESAVATAATVETAYRLMRLFDGRNWLGFSWKRLCAGTAVGSVWVRWHCATATLVHLLPWRQTSVAGCAVAVDATEGFRFSWSAFFLNGCTR